MARERWRYIPGWEDRYLVSHRGRVSSIATGKILKPALDHGYPHVTLHRNCKRTTRHVHILVLEAFRGWRVVGQVSRHLNGNRADNRLDNLRWGTRAENESDKRRHRTSGHKLTAAKARRIKRARGLQREVAQRFGVDRSLVSLIRSGKSWAGA